MVDFEVESCCGFKAMANWSQSLTFDSEGVVRACGFVQCRSCTRELYVLGLGKSNLIPFVGIQRFFCNCASCSLFGLGLVVFLLSGFPCEKIASLPLCLNYYLLVIPYGSSYKSG